MIFHRLDLRCKFRTPFSGVVVRLTRSKNIVPSGDISGDSEDPANTIERLRRTADDAELDKSRKG
jgi:hypothetical protein